MAQIKWSDILKALNKMADQRATPRVIGHIKNGHYVKSMRWPFY